MRRLLRPWLTTLALVASAPGLQAQEPWDTSFQLIGGQVGGSHEARLGSGATWAFAVEGAYPLFARGGVVLDAGYRTLPRTTTPIPGAESQSDWSQGAYGSIYYRHTQFTGIWRGLYLQVGARGSVLRTTREFGTGSSRVSTKGKEVSGFSPAFGLGYRFSDKLSLAVTAYQVKAQNLDLVNKTSTGVDLALGIHL